MEAAHQSSVSKEFWYAIMRAFGEWEHLATSMLMLQQPDNTKKTLLLAPPWR
jgi:hypothetical protein